MNDPIPDHSNKFAVWIGRVLHPYILPLPTTLIMLNDLPILNALGWMALTTSLILLPSLAFVTYIRRKGGELYRRRTRGPIYIFGWLCVLLCLVVISLLGAPPVLIASVGALAVWVPLQWAINTWVTKISGHAAVAAGCFVTLLVLGKLNPPIVLIGVVALVVFASWARIVTRNHSLTQVMLGILVGALPILVVFPLMRVIPF